MIKWTKIVSMAAAIVSGAYMILNGQQETGVGIIAAAMTSPNWRE